MGFDWPNNSNGVAIGICCLCGVMEGNVRTRYTMVAQLVFLIALCPIPLLWHLHDDQDGDTNKRTDLWIAGGLSCIIAFIGALAKLNPVAILTMCFAWHFSIFDYWINVLLAHNEVSQSHNWFEYMGKSAKMDKLWKRIGKWWRFAIRTAVLLLGLYLYFTLNASTRNRYRMLEHGGRHTPLLLHAFPLQGTQTLYQTSYPFHLLPSVETGVSASTIV
jgi:hypothetical protein